MRLLVLNMGLFISIAVAHISSKHRVNNLINKIKNTYLTEELLDLFLKYVIMVFDAENKQYNYIYIYIMERIQDVHKVDVQL